MIGGLELVINLPGNDSGFHVFPVRFFVSEIIPQAFEFGQPIWSLVKINALGQLLDSRPDNLHGISVGKDESVFLDLQIFCGNARD